MRYIKLGLLILGVSSASLSAQNSIQSSDGVIVNIENSSRIITLGGSVTETVYALGVGDRVIATDESSTFPSAVFRLPRVPYLRNLTSEGLISLGSSLIISSDDANPKSVIDQIRSAGTDVLLVEENESLEGMIAKVRNIAKAIGKEQEGEVIIQKNELEYHLADSLRKTLNSAPKVLFVLSVRGESTFMVAGANSSASVMIELAGGQNAVTDFDGYKTISNEAIVAANPDYILVMHSRLDEIRAGIEKTPAVNLTKAVVNNNVIGMDGNYLLGFGPRFGAAIIELIQKIHPTVTL
tara:strand:- start:3199 stop:4086 length:888 start_codon:yes stop_codon:yes gene_type:complete